MKQSEMKLGRSEQGWVSRIEGPGTVQESPAFERLVARILEQSPDARLIVDFTDCEMLDSTFLGCLASLHRRFSVGALPRMAIYGPPEVIERLFGPTQLNRHLQVRAVAPQFADELAAGPTPV